MSLPDPFEPIRKQNERIRDALDPPVMGQLRQLQAQQARIREQMINPPVMRHLQQLQEHHARIRDLIIAPPALRQLQQLEEQQARIQKMINPPSLRQLQQLEEQQARMQALFGTPIIRSLREERAEWDELLTPEAVAEIESFQADLASRVAPPEEAREAPGEAWLGAASWAALLAEIEGLLKALEVIVAAMTASKMALDAPIPTAIVALLIVLVSASEFALWLAKRELGD
jgi:hypothetical protein